MVCCALSLRDVPCTVERKKDVKILSVIMQILHIFSVFTLSHLPS